MQWRDAAVSYGKMRRRLVRVLLAPHYCKWWMIGVMASVISWFLMAGYPLAIVEDAVIVSAGTAERRCSVCWRRWIWWIRLVQVRGNVQ